MDPVHHDQPRDDAAVLLAVESLQVAYGAIGAVRDASLDVRSGEIVALLGANGAGKSSTMRAIAGLVPVRDGRVLLDGADVTNRPPELVARAGIALVPEGRHVFPSLTVEENLLLGGAARRGRGELREERERMLTQFPILHERAHQRAGTLSGGEQQMLAIARALMAGPRILLLDEPSLGLAPIIVEEVFVLLGELRAAGLTILCVEQNAAQILELADRAYVMVSGRVTATAAGAGAATLEALERAYLGGEER